MNERDPAAIGEFRAKWSSAFQAVVDSPQYLDHLERFRFAYEYRRQFPWLSESQKGLVGAVEGVVAVYGPNVVDTDTAGLQGKSEVDDRFLDELRATGIKLSTDPVYMETFALSLGRARVLGRGKDVRATSHTELEEHIAQAFNCYSAVASAGVLA